MGAKCLAPSLFIKPDVTWVAWCPPHPGVRGFLLLLTSNLCACLWAAVQVSWAWEAPRCSPGLCPVTLPFTPSPPWLDTAAQTSPPPQAHGREPQSVFPSPDQF